MKNAHQGTCLKDSVGVNAHLSTTKINRLWPALNAGMDVGVAEANMFAKIAYLS